MGRGGRTGVRPAVNGDSGSPPEVDVVEYALLNGLVALRTIAMSVGNFVEGVNWPIVIGFAAAAAIAWWSMKPKGPYR